MCVWCALEWRTCSSYPFKEDQVILTGWEDDIADIGKNMIEEQSPKQYVHLKFRKFVMRIKSNICLLIY